MNRDDAMFEEVLCGQRPSRLESDVFARLHAALDEACAPVEAPNPDVEAWLDDRRPSRLPQELMDRLGGLVAPAPQVIPMPGPVRVHAFRRYAVAAAVAMIGAAAALLAPIGGERQESSIVAAESDAPTMSLSAAREFVPAAYARSLSEARDEGIVWRNNAPHRVLRIVYSDTITLTNEAGEVVEMEQPRVEYIVVPEKID